MIARLTRTQVWRPPSHDRQGFTFDCGAHRCDLYPTTPEAPPEVNAAAEMTREQDRERESMEIEAAA